MTNPIINTDSYKYSHWLQYPPGTQYVSSYIESRGLSSEVKDDWDDEIVFFGLQGFIKEYMNIRITDEFIEEAAEVAKLHGEPFNYQGFKDLMKDYGGLWPVVITALPEGTVASSRNCLVQVTNLDPKYFWVTSFLETALLRAIWYPTTVATQSREIKKVIKKYMLETAGHTDGLDFKLHDFGARGASSSETAQIGGGAHLVNFMGTDTVETLLWLRRNYNEPMAAYSVPAAEHSTMTTWGGREGEVESFRNMLKQYAGKYPIISVVSDSYDIYNAIDNLWGGVLKEEVVALEAAGSKLVVRPDSGDPTIVPVECIERLMTKFGYTTNALGYKVLPPFIGVLQGDGIDIRSIKVILENMKQRGLSAENIVFGMGGALLQKVNRDTLKFAMKASAITINGKPQDVFKDPVHDKGKSSKRGFQAVIKEDGVIKTVRSPYGGPEPEGNLMRLVWAGDLKVEDTLAQIRERAKV